MNKINNLGGKSMEFGQNHVWSIFLSEQKLCIVLSQFWFVEENHAWFPWQVFLKIQKIAYMMQNSMKSTQFLYMWSDVEKNIRVGPEIFYTFVNDIAIENWYHHLNLPQLSSFSLGVYIDILFTIVIKWYKKSGWGRF